MINMEKRNLKKVFIVTEVLLIFSFVYIILELSGGYHFAGNPEEIFEKFFAKTNPYA